jgi:hypothetical protein
LIDGLLRFAKGRLHALANRRSVDRRARRPDRRRRGPPLYRINAERANLKRDEMRARTFYDDVRVQFSLKHGPRERRLVVTTRDGDTIGHDGTIESCRQLWCEVTRLVRMREQHVRWRLGGDQFGQRLCVSIGRVITQRIVLEPYHLRNLRLGQVFRYSCD